MKLSNHGRAHDGFPDQYGHRLIESLGIKVAPVFRADLHHLSGLHPVDQKVDFTDVGEQFLGMKVEHLKVVDFGFRLEFQTFGAHQPVQTRV